MGPFNQHLDDDVHIRDIGVHYRGKPIVVEPRAEVRARRCVIRQDRHVEVRRQLLGGDYAL